jgi:predicted transcriptional regulator
VQWIDELKTVRLLEMNSDNTLLRSSEATLKDIQAWAKQESPYTVSKDAAYLIVEETYETKQGTAYVKHTVYDRPQRNDVIKPLHTFHFPRENGLTEAASMNIEF